MSAHVLLNLLNELGKKIKWRFVEHFIRVCTVCPDKNGLQRQKYCTSFHRNFDWQPLKLQNGQFHTYCYVYYGIIKQNENCFSTFYRS